MKESGSNKGWYGKRPPRTYQPPETIPDTLVVPEKTIMMVPYHPCAANNTYIEPLDKMREWFPQHAYLCLPLVFGNQHGFLIRAAYGFNVSWNGGDLPGDVTVKIDPAADKSQGMRVEPHFGFGIVTVQTGIAFRTPENVNLMVKAPPNYFKDGTVCMEAVVESDNLRRDFTLNLKITRPNHEIFFAKGDPIACILPYPRYFLDGYKLDELKDEEELRKAQKTMEYFGISRTEHEAGFPGFCYIEGEDIYGIPFRHHQKSLDGGKMWREKIKDMEAEKS